MSFLRTKSTDNAGFLRENAKLFVIFMSDEEDQSPDSGSEEPVSYYVDTLMNVKNGDPNMLGAAAIVGLPTDTCAQEGSRYLDFVDVVGGVKSTICTNDFSPALQELGEAITDPPDSFYLDNSVVPGTLEVYIDGVLQPGTAWVYDEPSNQVSLWPRSRKERQHPRLVGAVAAWAEWAAWTFRSASDVRERHRSYLAATTRRRYSRRPE